MSNLSWLSHPALQKMDKRKLEIMKEFITESEGKTLTQSLPILAKTNQQLKSENLSFTKEESALIMDILTKDLSPSEKMKLEAIKNIVPF